MRLRRLVAGLLAASLLAASPAWAIFGDSEAHKRIDEQVKALQAATEQMRALDGRIGAVEGTVNGGTLLNLLNQIEALTAEIARLRGELEAANNRLDIADKRARDLYLDVDGRLRVLETPPPVAAASAAPTAPAASSQPPTAPPAIADTGLRPDAPPAETVPMPAVSTGAQPTPATAPSPTGAPKGGPVAQLAPARPGSAGELASEAAAYEAAHAARREARYGEAARLFQQFIAAHPNSPLAAPAQYWTGDSLFNTKDYAGAIAAQKRLLDTWPGSAKVPDALLNMASAMRDGGDLAGERKTLEQLVARHPASEAAEKARKRLAAKR
jgi:tol-pal system protein YbgF